MRFAIVLPAWVSLAAAQLLTTSQLQAIPNPVIQVVPAGANGSIIPYDPNAAYAAAFNSFVPSSRRKRSALKKRTAPNCEVQPLGSGPVPSPDTDTAFLASTAISQAAVNAVTPAGWIETFQNQQAAVSSSAYMGYKTYSTYDPSLCAADCLASTGCESFNLFFERDPTLNPAAACLDPPSTTIIKCSFWGVTIGPASLTNTGQYRGNFHVVNAGSNGYTLASPSYNVPGYNGTSTSWSTINAPSACNSYITYKSHTGTYDPNLCAADCAAQRLETNPFMGLKCRFFASYQLLKNGQVQAQICALYSRTWDASYATNTGYTSGSDVYTIANAYSFTYEADIGSFSCGTQSSSSSTTAMTTTSCSPTTTPVITTTTTTRASTTSSTTTKCSTTTSASPTPSCLKSCPGGSYYATASNGQLYNYCSNTDYKIPNPIISWNCPSISACASICEQGVFCVKAVYDPINKICYSQNNPSDGPSNWLDPIWILAPSAPYYTTIKKVPDGTPINFCPGNIFSVTAKVQLSKRAEINKRTFCSISWFSWLSWLCPTPAPAPAPAPQWGTTNYNGCPKTDFNYNTPNTWNNVACEADCLTLCAKSNQCLRVSYNAGTKTCYGKGSSSSDPLANLVVQSHCNSYAVQK